MKVGDLVRDTTTCEVHIITGTLEAAYYEVDNQWLVPEEHLEVLSESH